MIIKICETCRNEYKTWPYRIRDGVRFCSSKCRGISDRGKIIGYWKGRKFSIIHKKRLSEAKMGEKSGKAWKGGITKDANKYYREYARERRKDPIIAKKMSESSSKWAKRNKEKKYYWNLKRIITKLNAEGEHSLIEWLQLKHRFNNKCLRCERIEGEIVLTQDHIIPISKGGSDNIENIQPLCRSCNSSKNDKYVDYRKGDSYVNTT